MKLIISRYKTIDLITAFLIVLYISLSLISELMLFGVNSITQLHIIFSGILVVISTQYNVKFRSITNGIPKITILFLTIFMFIIFNSIFIRYEILFGAFFNLVMGIIIGKYIAISKYSAKLLLLPFWFLVSIIILKLFENPDPNQVFIRSRNYISFFLILTVLPYYFIRINSFKSLSILPAIITLLLCFYSLGRSGIISSLILFVGVIMASQIDRRVKKFFGYFFLFIAIFIFSFYLENYLAVNEFERISNLSNYSNLGGRSTFFKNYYENLDLFSFIFGMDTNTYKILNIGGGYLPGHVHSSILNFISVVGICSFLFLFFILKKMKSTIKNNLPLVFLFAALMLRIFTETGVLFGYFDYVVWMFFFANTSKNSKNIIRE